LPVPKLGLLIGDWRSTEDAMNNDGMSLLSDRETPIVNGVGVRAAETFSALIVQYRPASVEPYPYGGKGLQPEGLGFRLSP
jgi:hypothetical protein